MKLSMPKTPFVFNILIIIILSSLFSTLVYGVTSYDVEGFVEDRTASQVPTGVVVNVTYVDPKGVSNYSTDVLTQNGGPACIVKYGGPSCTNYFYVPASDDGQGVNSTWKIYAYSEYSGWYGINDTEYPIGSTKKRVDIGLTNIVDRDPPNTTLINPQNNTINTTSKTIYFSYNVTDVSNISSCSLIIGDDVNKTSTDIIRNQTLIFNQTFENNNYTWAINCTDIKGYTGASETWEFGVDAYFPPVIDQIWAVNSTINHSFTIYANATDDSILSCDVYYGTSSPPTQKKSGTLIGSNPYTCSATLSNYTDNLPVSSAIYARIQFNDEESLSVNTSIISNNIPNHDPTVDYVNIVPSFPVFWEDLTCNYSVSDSDSDNTNVEFNWYKNGAAQNIYSQTLGEGNSSIGELWSCSINVTDEYSAWSYNMSSNVSIFNAGNISDFTADEGVFELAGVYGKSVTLDTFNIIFNNITAVTGDELECKLITASNSTNPSETKEVNYTFTGNVNNVQISINHTLQAGDVDGSYDNTWFWNNCSLKNNAGSVKLDLNVTNKPIYVKTKKWYADVSGKNIAVDAANAYQAWKNSFRWYFAHDEANSTDVDFAFNKFVGVQNFEGYCDDSSDNDGDTLVDCDDPDCQTLFYPECSGIRPNQSEGGFGTFSDPDTPCFGNICQTTIGGVTVYYTQEVSPGGSLKVQYIKNSIDNEIVALTLKSTGSPSFLMSDENTSLYNNTAALSYKLMTPASDGIVASSRPDGASSETFTGNLNQVINVSMAGLSVENYTMNFDVYIGSGLGNADFTVYVDNGEAFNELESDANLDRNLYYISGTSTTNNSCNDGVNNDLNYDGTDCADPDCNGIEIGKTLAGDNITCQYSAETNCWDGFDNDEDGLVDCADPNCDGEIGAYINSTTSLPVKYFISGGNYTFCEYGSTAEGTNNYTATPTSPSSCDDNFNNDALDYGNQWNTFSCDGTYADCRGKNIDCFDPYSCWGRNMSVSSDGGVCPLKEDQCDDGLDNDYDVDLMGTSSNWLNILVPDPVFSTTGADCDDYDCYGISNGSGIICSVSSTNITEYDGIDGSSCFDGVDNDLDKYTWNGTEYILNLSGGIDCDDPDCINIENPANSSQACREREFELGLFNFCYDAIDNDYDTEASCADRRYDKINSSLWASNVADLTNTDCWAKFDNCGPCPTYEDITYDSCADSTDNDLDDGSGAYSTGASGADCADSDCAGELATYSGTICVASGNENSADLCLDGVDNDGDGNIDYSDSDCNAVATTIGTIYTSEGSVVGACSDDFDNDNDGVVDCLDPGCFGVGGCSAGFTSSGLTTVPSYSSWTALAGGDLDYLTIRRVHRNKTGEYFTINLRSHSGYNHGSSKVQIVLGTAIDNLSLDVAIGDITLSGDSLSDFSCGTSCKDWTDNVLTLKDSGFDGLSANGGVLDLTVTIPVPESTSLGEETFPISANTDNGVSSGDSDSFTVYEKDEPLITEMLIEPLNAGTATIDYGDSVGFKATPQDPSSGVYGCRLKLDSQASAMDTNCRRTYAITTEGSHTIYVNATDSVSNIGPTNSTTFSVDIRPVETSSTHKLDRAFYDSSYSTIDIGTFSFQTTSSDTFTGTCLVVFTNQTGNIISTTTASQGGGSSTSCGGSIALPSSISNNDGMYFVYVNISDSDGYTLKTDEKVFYTCNSLLSSGTNWDCAKADRDNDGATEGIYTSLYGSSIACDNCIGLSNPNQIDSDADGLGDICEAPGAPETSLADMNEDNSSVDLNWTASADADSYTVYYSTNFSLIENLDIYNIPSGVLNVTGITDLNWTDALASQFNQRYYRVAAFKSVAGNLSEDINCKFDFQFFADSPRTFSLPCFPNNLSLNNVLRPAQGYDGDVQDSIRMFYYDGGNKEKTAFWYGPDFGWSSFTTPPLDYFEPGIAYYLYPINNSYNTTIAGSIWGNGSITFNFVKDSPKSISVPYPRFYFLNSTIRPAQAYDGNVQDTIRLYYSADGDNKQKTAQWYGPQWGWYSFSTPQLNYLEPGKGYYLFPINNSYNQTINFSTGVMI
ncbi:hypothetical protein ACFL0W_02875 [Nanoarchaeota archaeon]